LAIRRLFAVYGLILLAALFFSAWRLRELTLGSVDRRVWLPFLHPLLGAGFEISVLIALPPALLVARAAGLTRATCALAFAGLAAIGVWGSLHFDPSDQPPGQMAEGLLHIAREHCEQTPERRADVPLIAMSWTCPPTGARLHGRAPMGKKAEFSASGVLLAPDLRTISLTDLELKLGASSAFNEIRIAAARATIRGLTPWGRPADVPLGRRLLRAVLAALATCLVGGFILERRRPSGMLVFVLSALAALSALFAQRWLDRYAGAGLWYFSLVLVGPATLGLGAVALSAIERFSRRSPVAR
jgi:hypothetical protein